MRKRRAAWISLACAALLAVPATAAATVSPAAGAHTLGSVDTQIRWMRFGHLHVAGATMAISGQVTATMDGDEGAIAGATVKLYRRLDGESNWVYLSTKTTDDGATPRFTFSTISRQNAHYKVAYAGDDTFAATSSQTWLSVHRTFSAVIHDGTGSATLSGHVSPYYTHKSVIVQRRSCAACSYRDYRSATSGAGGVYSFKLPAPPTGRWWWRVRTPKTAAFIASYSGTFTTELK